MFLDEFVEWLPDQLAKYKNVVLMGDINFHLNNVDDPDTSTLRDTLDGLGLTITFPHTGMEIHWTFYQLK